MLALLDRTAALRHGADVVHRRLGADLAAGANRIAEDDTMEVVAVVGARTEELNGLVIGPQEGLGGQAAVLRRTVAVHDYCMSRDITHDFDHAVRAEGLRAAMVAPIVRAHRLYGLLYAARRSPVAWTDRDRAELLSLARQAAVAMEVADSAREMAEVAAFGERQRLAIRLHDSVGATLFSLRVALMSAQEETEPGRREELLSDALVLTERATSELRAQTLSLHDLPEDKALAVTLEGDCRDFATRTGTAAELVVLGDLPLLDSARTDALRRTAREALLNVEKHAGAHSVVVSLYRAEEGVGLTVADDGTAPDIASEHRRGLGLRATVERIERVGGWLSCTANEEGGGTIQAWVPAARAFRPVGP
ncbi:GAF domain-containing sensor histidine kinase [Mycobacterium marinum]|uniref:GAF domain-containing sensor histidine kinase n=1 Tax=Mycobacterium marinum TaxID=1781 RepID=UPI00235A2EC1|nr:GAF domain-containing protein [Mycobacterium marinum]MDC9007650.1 GAF domain-containing protein [Mycobacterium marinum]